MQNEFTCQTGTGNAYTPTTQTSPFYSQVRSPNCVEDDEDHTAESSELYAFGDDTKSGDISEQNGFDAFWAFGNPGRSSWETPSMDSSARYAVRNREHIKRKYIKVKSSEISHSNGPSKIQATNRNINKPGDPRHSNMTNSHFHQSFEPAGSLRWSTPKSTSKLLNQNQKEGNRCPSDVYSKMYTSESYFSESDISSNGPTKTEVKIHNGSNSGDSKLYAYKINKITRFHPSESGGSMGWMIPKTPEKQPKGKRNLKKKHSNESSVHGCSKLRSLDDEGNGSDRNEDGFCLMKYLKALKEVAEREPSTRRIKGFVDNKARRTDFGLADYCTRIDNIIKKIK